MESENSSFEDETSGSDEDSMDENNVRFTDLFTKLKYVFITKLASFKESILSYRPCMTT